MSYKEKYLKYKNKYLILQSNIKYLKLFSERDFSEKSHTLNKHKYNGGGIFATVEPSDDMKIEEIKKRNEKLLKEKEEQILKHKKDEEKLKKEQEIIKQKEINQIENIKQNETKNIDNNVNTINSILIAQTIKQINDETKTTKIGGG